MNRALLAAAATSLVLAGCVSDQAPQYSLTGNETGVFRTANAGRPIAVSAIKGMDESQLTATFGAARLDRKDAASRVLRYQSDGCSLFVYMSGPKAQYVEAYDPQLRPLINVDACAGSVAAQRRAV
jgi:nitrous oxide reductase accessory protein NosL